MTEVPPAARLDRALERGRREERAVSAERDALKAFLCRVDELSAGETPLADGGTRATAGLAGTGRRGGPDELAAVREAFVELVVPVVPDHVEDGSPAVTMRDELGPEVAGALAGAGPLTPPLRAVLRESVAKRRRELDATETLLDRERAQLRAARGTVTDAVEWLHEADGTPLTALGFDALAERHERLTDIRGRCEALVAERQSFLRGTTGRDGCRVTHEPFFAYLYGEADSPTADHPVLAGAADLATLATEARRAVRTHLTRRA
jgi:hypothetical protein